MFSHAFILGFLDFVVPNLFLSSFCYLIWCWLSVRYEQSVRFQEEDHDIIKGLYATCSSWHIDPWNNREVWVDNISIWKGCFQVIYWLLAELLRFSCLSQKKND